MQKLKGNLTIDDDIILIYKDKNFKIFIDEHCYKYDLFYNGIFINARIRLFILDKKEKHIMIINSLSVKIDKFKGSLEYSNNYHYSQSREKSLILDPILNKEEVKKKIFNFLDEKASY